MHMVDKNEKNMKRMEQWRQLTFGQKLQYLWDYEKWILVMIVVVICMICTGITIYHNMKTEVLLRVIVTDAQSDGTALAEQFRAYLGATGENQIVEIDNTVVTNEENSMVGGASTMKLTSLIAANNMDVMICNESLYEQFEEQGAFLDIREVLGADTEDYAEDIVGDVICMDAEKLNGIEPISPYEKIYVAVLVNSENRENAADFIRFLEQ